MLILSLSPPWARCSNASPCICHMSQKFCNHSSHFVFNSGYVLDGLMSTMLIKFQILHWFCPHLICELDRQSKHFSSLFMSWIDLMFALLSFKTHYIKKYNPNVVGQLKWYECPGFCTILLIQCIGFALINKGLALSVRWIFPLCLLINFRINMTWQRTNLLTIKLARLCCN